VVICLERGANLHMSQRISLPLTVSCFSKIQIGFTFRAHVKIASRIVSIVPAHLGSPGQRAVKRVCVCVCVFHGIEIVFDAWILSSRMVDPSRKVPDLNCEVQDLLLEVVDLK